MQSIETGGRGSLDPRKREEETAGSRGGPVGVIYPEFGPIEALVGFGVFATLVDRLTPAASAAMADRAPSLVDPLTTGAAVLLWVVAGITVFSLAVNQLRPNPRTFADREDRAAFLDEHRPDEADYGRHLVLMILGGATALLAWETVLAVFEGMLPVVIEAGGELPASLTLGNVAIFVVFFVAIAAYARALDYLVVGGAREFIYRHYTGDWD